MRAELLAVVDELKRRRADGEQGVYLSDETLRTVRERVKAISNGSPAASDRAATAPEQSTLQSFTKSANNKKPIAQTKQDAESSVEVLPSPPVIELPEGTKQERWEWLKRRVLECPVCNSHIKDGKQVVFGKGDLDASIFFCGEAPGADEEIAGEPFVGKAGQLLSRIITAMGLAREQVYIGNIMNWRPELPTPTGNRPPTPEEMAFCLPYLRAQVEIVRPKAIVALGNTAITGLLGADPSRRLGKIRGKWHDFEGTPLMPTYHPSYVMRYGSNKTKREIWEDMLAVMEHVGLTISDKQRAFFS